MTWQTEGAMTWQNRTQSWVGLALAHARKLLEELSQSLVILPERKASKADEHSRASAEQVKFLGRSTRGCVNEIPSSSYAAYMDRPLEKILFVASSLLEHE